MAVPEKIKTFVSKPYIILFVILALLFCLDDFILKPFITDHYLEEDLTSFKDFSWKYLAIIAVLLAIVLIIISKAKKILPILILCAFSAFLVFFGLITVLTHILLYINVQTEKEDVINTYEVIHHHETFWLHAGEENSIHGNKAIQLIDKKRKEKNQNSILEYKTGDTVKVTFKKGIFNVNYLD